MEGSLRITVARQGKELGSFGEDDIRAGLLRGTLLGSDHYWHVGMSGWQTLRELYPHLCGPAAQHGAPPPIAQAAPTVIIHNNVSVKNKVEDGGGCGCVSGCGLVVIFLLLVGGGTAVLGPFGFILGLVTFIAIAVAAKR